MFIAINLTKYVFVGKHPNFEKLVNAISDDQDSWYFCQFDCPNNYENFADEELQLLYMNLTQNFDGCQFSRKDLINIIISYIGCIDETLSQSELAIGFSADFENYVSSHGIAYEYFKPRVSAEFAGSGEAYSTEPREKRERKVTAPGESKTPQRGACAHIWETAEQLWQADQNVEHLNQIKKDARIALIAEGVNSSTVSVQLSKWAKTKLN